MEPSADHQPSNSPPSQPRIWIADLNRYRDQVVRVAGWLTGKRDHGKLLFLDLRDSTGVIQAVVMADQPFFTPAHTTKEGSALELAGKVTSRPPSTVTKTPNGTIELNLTDYAVLGPAKDFPWGSQPPDKVGEELRLRYRYLDLRSDHMIEALGLRAEVIHFVGNYLHDQGFLEVETPYITKGTPEGAREYLVPSRLHPGQFYALPQSPQQFKQLLMVGGIDRYYQIARCFRDEDPRGDRQPEFTQLDVEMSFVTRDEVLTLAEGLFSALIGAVCPKKKILQRPFPRLSFQEAMTKYGTDHVDLRRRGDNPDELALCWIIDQPLFTLSESERKLVAVHHLFTRPRPGDEELLDHSPQKVLAASYDLVCNGIEIAGGSLRVHEPSLQAKIFAILGIGQEEASSRFGHLLEALSYGAPPHGGFASGLDRLVMVLANRPNIREVIAFPKTGDGRDLMMGAPAPVSEDELAERHITLRRGHPGKQSGSIS